jgi:hypothetical protein
MGLIFPFIRYEDLEWGLIHFDNLFGTILRLHLLVMSEA